MFTLQKGSFFSVFLSLAFFISLSAQALTYDFENEKQLDDWAITEDKGTWEIKDGVLDFDNPGKAAGGLSFGEIGIALKEIEFLDGTIEVKVKWVQGSNFEGMLYYRYMEIGNFYSAYVSANDGTARWLAEKAGAVDVRKAPIKVEADKWYQIKVVAEGEHQMVYFDDELVHDLDDDFIDKGLVGFGTWAQTAEHCQFDDFVINGQGIPAEAVEPVGKLAITWGKVKKF